ncbi:MAG: nucleoside phosphorylase [Bacteroidota bacterium]|nr:nucleoside phosphorylase [Bacteroidota bacterium]
MKHFPSSELIINDDGSIFHLHLLPEQLAEKIILVGDPGRVEMIASYFENIECDVANREFRTITGTYKGKRLTVVGTGIGTDNIDIVVNELDALSNIDLINRTEKPEHKQLTFVRIGTSGAVQPDIRPGTYVLSEKSIGFDGVLNFYANRNTACDIEFEKAFTHHVNWHPQWCAPYVADNDPELVERIGKDDMLRGVTISANGFYGPQGRELRLPLAHPTLNDNIETFRYGRFKVTNYEMESSAIAGLSKLMGHKAVTVCCIIANRRIHDAFPNYKESIQMLVEKVLDRI